MNDKHRCENWGLKDRAYGTAIGECWEEDGELWVGNGEYANIVYFCPFCGYKLKEKTK